MSQPDRPMFHFTAPSGWLNDPNGTLYCGGEYHLFYQHHPHSLEWGPMHWGHAVSRDLLRWEHLPIALYPDEIGTIFSGSAVIDERNTSSLGEAGKAPMVAVFTHHGGKDESQSLAWSLDRGRTFQKYAGNPVLREQDARDFRDPKVFWHEPSQAWVMVVSHGDRLRLYRSANLLKWELMSEICPPEAPGVILECPDLFKLPCGIGSAWVLTYSMFESWPGGCHRVRYITGTFDGVRFTADSEPRFADAGWDFYAPVTFGQVPGRSVWLGWMADPAYAGCVPSEVWNGRMTLPRELGLATVSGRKVFTQQPARELLALRREAVHPVLERRTEHESARYDSCNGVFVVEGTLSSDNRGLEIGLLGCLRLTIEPVSGQVVLKRTAQGSIFHHPAFIGERQSALPEPGTDVDFLIVVDGNSVEMFLQGGALVFSALAFPEKGRGGCTVTAYGNSLPDSLTVHRLTI